ncbi:MAG: hypothetical protein RLZZ387_195 [Chloroflexota bacterium]
MSPAATETPPLTLDDLGAAALAHLVDSALDGVLVLDDARLIRYASAAACEIAQRPAEQLLGSDLLALVGQGERADVASHLAIAPGARVDRRSATMVRPSGEQREIEYVAAGIASRGAALTVVTVRDVTETRRVVRWAATLAQISSSVAYAGTLESTLGSLARTLVRVTGIAACTVLLIDRPERHAWRAAATFGLPPGYTEALEAVWREGIVLPSVEAYDRRQPVVQSGVRQLVLGEPRCAPLHPFMLEIDWDVLVAVPLVVRGRPVGTLVGYYRPEDAPGEDEIAFLSVIADQAAVAVENTRLFIEAQGKAALEERQKLARELHDSVSQALYGIALGARTARELIDRDPPRAIGPIDYVASLAEAGLAEMRALIFELRPESLATEGLVAALSKQSASLRARHGITVHAALPEEPDAPLHVKEALYRIAQEALHNIIRHARATTVELRLYAGDEPSPQHAEPAPLPNAPTPPSALSAQLSAPKTRFLVLEVHDDGQGFETGGQFPGHLGLRSMRERAISLGGELQIESAPGAGTRLVARVPH